MEQFPKGKRLLTRLDYSRVFSKSKRIHNRAFTLLIHFNDNTTSSKMGMVVSKKVHKTAVQRNRIKRLIRESFRTKQNLNTAEYVIMAKPGSARYTNTELLAFLNQLWSQTEKK
ncbi:ribonuclease P protein component [Marinicella sp. S1101]|uniref:ribonuclease P protein component n=1 Tax=Marinicella marina TaxID=2996016 RepID=UPI0022609C31|nr:ribonuclease P protein component [Marinicella marina]MCX7553166.1 ribonuclease P protein component [Marinicella marina]MDJ1138898.1 ribonuclease P protein component [Marinicella marina]